MNDVREGGDSQEEEVCPAATRGFPGSPRASHLGTCSPPRTSCQPFRELDRPLPPFLERKPSFKYTQLPRRSPSMSPTMQRTCYHTFLCTASMLLVCSPASHSLSLTHSDLVTSTLYCFQLYTVCTIAKPVPLPTRSVIKHIKVFRFHRFLPARRRLLRSGKPC